MIQKAATNKQKHLNKIDFVKNARSGWRSILKSLNSNDKVLLPSYIGITDREGSGIYDPIVETNTQHDFYMLDSNLDIKIDDLKQQLENNEYKLILLVHYFGFKIQNYDSIIKLCRDYNLIIVEDCAHLYNYNLKTTSNVGSLADFVVYSLHKVFPFENGGLIVQQNQDIVIEDNDYDYSKDLFTYNIEDINSKRRNNWYSYANLLRIPGVIHMRNTLTVDDIPQTYPIIIEDNLREELYFWLAERDITLIALYYRLIDPLQNDKYSDMQYISKSILNLPTHQDTDVDDIKLLIENIQQFFDEKR